MPTVPRQQRQVEIGALQNTAYQGPGMSGNAPIEAFGGGAAAQEIKAVSGLAGTVGKVVEEERARADDTVTKQKYAELSKKKQDLLWGDGGALSQKGTNAFAAPDTYGKQFDTYADEMEKNLSPSQLSMFRQIRQKERLEFDGQIMRHVFGEKEKVQTEATASGIQVARQDAVYNYHDEAAIKDKIGLQESLFISGNPGIDSATREAGIKKIRSSTHAAVIERMIDNGEDINAKAYADKYKSELGDHLADIEKSVASGSLAGESQRKADEIFSKSKSMAVAMEQTKSIEDIKVRDETVKRLKDQFSLQRLAEQDAEEKNHKAAGNIIDQTGSTDKIPRSTWNTFTVSEKQSLEAYAKHKREGTEPATDWNEYYNLKTMASTPEMRSDFMRINMLKYRNKLGDAEFKELINAQNGLRTGDDKTAKLLDGYRSDSEVVNTEIQAAGIDVTPKEGSNDAVKLALVKKKIDERIIQHQSATNKKATSADIQKITSDILMEGVTKKGWLWDTKKRKFELQPGESFQLNIEDVPQDDRQKIEQKLRSRGINPTEAKIVDIYSKKVSR